MQKKVDIHRTEFEPMIPVVDRSKVIRTLYRAATWAGQIKILIFQIKHGTERVKYETFSKFYNFQGRGSLINRTH